jgi:hypothetical protein
LFVPGACDQYTPARLTTSPRVPSLCPWQNRNFRPLPQEQGGIETALSVKDIDPLGFVCRLGALRSREFDWNPALALLADQHEVGEKLQIGEAVHHAYRRREVQIILKRYRSRWAAESATRSVWHRVAVLPRGPDADWE